MKSTDETSILTLARIETPLGPMMAIADDNALYLLEFAAQRNLNKQMEQICAQLNAHIVDGDNSILRSIKTELAEYFKRGHYDFRTPIHMVGSDFQKTVWRALQSIPSGQTRSYLEIAKAIQRPTASRAVARANSTNRFAIMIPCHRVINTNGQLGGYAGGVERKQWLLAHESA
jgi:AraC family transcriptional regulator, regulatory protein of adaptative response / methylated-DNA-[protein]-cysteine methyltransferase